MKPFHFQQYSVNQSSEVFRVGTDAVLLGSLCSAENSRHVLEVGTGTGIISLMIAQRNSSAEILALDINENAAALAQENFQNSRFQNRLHVLKTDFKNFETERKFDFIVSNPPYFEENSSEKDILARQQTELSFSNLVKNASKLLSGDGTFSVIIPFETGVIFIKTAEQNQLFLKRKINIYGIENSKIKRLILEFSLDKIDVEESDFVIEISPRKYSDQYLELTKDFHVFGK